MAKYPGKDNGADLMTKYKGREDTPRLLGRIGFQKLSGRPQAAPKRTTSWDIGRPIPPPREVNVDTNSCEIAHPVDLIQDYLHIMPFKTCILEGRSLNPEGRLPTRGCRILLWVEDLNAGKTLYSYSEGQFRMNLT